MFISIENGSGNAICFAQWTVDSLELALHHQILFSAIFKDTLFDWSLTSFVGAAVGVFYTLPK